MKNHSRTKYFIALLINLYPLQFSSSFTVTTQFLETKITPLITAHSTSSTSLRSVGDDDEREIKELQNLQRQQQSNGENKKSQEDFLEKSSLDGAKNIRSISIAERAKLAMLAEAVEDRISDLTEDLEVMLGDDGMPKKADYREEVELLARQIKASREQYASLVSGEELSLTSIGLDSDSSDRGDDLE